MWAQNFMIGQILAGRYRVVQVLGAGGFGETYITADLHLPGEPQCVLKHLKPATDDPAVLDIARKLFQKEAETLQQLGSFDKIPRLLAYFEEQKEFYLVQELVRGHTLSRELTSGQRWPEAAVRKMLGEVLSILEFVHSQGVIHRDIKPDNIMRRDADGCLVLIDFGAIKQVRNQATMGTAPQTVAIGTPGYMSPEQARGNPRPSSDLYALGVIGIQALSGKYPSELIEDDATGELQWQHFVQASPLMVAHLSEMTRYHFRDRFTTASAALQALKNIDGEELTLPLPPQSPPQAPVQKTEATYVVSPAQPVQQPQRPDPVQNRPPARPANPTTDNPIGTIIGAAALIGVSGFAGYSGWSMFKTSQYEQALTSNQCRMATPNKGGNVTKVRFEPDRNSGIIGNLQRGEKFVALQIKEAFVEIQQPNGKRGWVFSDQIDLCFKPIATPTPTATKSPQSNKPSPPPTINTPTPASPSPSPPSIAPTPSSSSSPSPTPSSSPSNQPSIITIPSPTSIDLTPPPIALPTQNPATTPTPISPSNSPSQPSKPQDPNQ
jgi:serine/threonine protein kinase, bacterial